jgi:hypothetical protein
VIASIIFVSRITLAELGPRQLAQAEVSAQTRRTPQYIQIVKLPGAGGTSLITAALVNRWPQLHRDSRMRS